MQRLQEAELYEFLNAVRQTLNKKNAFDDIEMSLLDKLPTEIMIEVYEYDNTKKDNFRHVLRQYKICCHDLDHKLKYYPRYYKTVSFALLENVKKENRARAYFDSMRDTNYSFH